MSSECDWVSFLLLLASFALPQSPPQEKLIPFEKGDRWGYRNAQGKVAIEPRYVIAREFFPEGIAAVADEKEWAYIDRKGNVVIKPFIFDNGPDYFSEGLARFTVNKKFGFFDTHGRVVIKPQFDFAMPFHDGLAAFCTRCSEKRDGEHSFMEGGRWGFINRNGEVVIPPIYEKVPGFRFAGLDGLAGFEPLAGAATPSHSLRSEPVSCGEACFPEALPARQWHTEAYRTDAVTVQDFRIPVQGSRSNLLLRQVLDRQHPRITEQYWALYENGLRVDCWFFSPAPEANSEGKLLAPYEVSQVLAGQDGSVVFRTFGSMHRPGGSGWMQGKDFVFTVSQSALKFQYAVGRFFLSYGARLEVNGERLIQREGQRVIEVRIRNSIPATALVRCGYQDPAESELEEAAYYRELERAVRCLLDEPDATTRYRRLAEPSFIERGGRPVE
jgi:hypothetical protein